MKKTEYIWAFLRIGMGWCCWASAMSGQGNGWGWEGGGNALRW